MEVARRDGAKSARGRLFTSCLLRPPFFSVSSCSRPPLTDERVSFYRAQRLQRNSSTPTSSKISACQDWTPHHPGKQQQTLKRQPHYKQCQRLHISQTTCRGPRKARLWLHSPATRSVCCCDPCSPACRLVASTCATLRSCSFLSFFNAFWLYFSDACARANVPGSDLTDPWQ